MRKKNNKNLVKKLVLSLAFSFNFSPFGWTIKIGIILPVSHMALENIVSGFRKKIEPYLNPQDQLIIKNANADSTLQYQIIQQFKQDNIDYFLPISTSTALMTLSKISDKPIIAIAAEIRESDLKTREAVGVICDEVPAKDLLKFLQNALPHVKKIGVIYGNCEKNEHPIKEMKDFCLSEKLTFFPRKVDTFSEISPAAQSVFPQVDVVIILKDHLIVSGLSVLIRLAKKHKKLLVAMDDISVRQGAHMALAVCEQAIGSIAAEHVINALAGHLEKAYYINKLTAKDIFLNEKAVSELDSTLIAPLIQAAEVANLTIRNV